ncbi:hypothetical protein [Rhodoplanes sp. Z2-YC6860]|uniref:hypothetical protein n=1 Tax=Rhodoplanes sp. Z2-YC6860 TaxID=674703 RepID=UPI00078B1EB3|nr:hypothetical protein [Rhodoplanes sp. Z2-YC6860]AMN39398.1 hypothetical protein RHPLAN_09360 [Rhodoplanes sp. Z2-YC6860]
MTFEAKTRRRRQSLGAIFVVPAILAMLSGIGLISALLGDGMWDGLSWLALSVPIVVVIWFALLRRRRGSRND